MQSVFEVLLESPSYTVGHSVRHIEYGTVQSYLASINLKTNRIIERCPPEEIPPIIKQNARLAGFVAKGCLYRDRSLAESNWSYAILYEGCLIID